MGKAQFIAAMLITWAGAANSADFNGQSYYGKTEGVGVGFWGHVGVGLPTGTTCRGQERVILLTTNPRYNEIYSILVTAESSGKQVKFYNVTNSITPTAGTTYCVIDFVALGNFYGW